MFESTVVMLLQTPGQYTYRAFTNYVRIFWHFFDHLSTHPSFYCNECSLFADHLPYPLLNANVISEGPLTKYFLL